MQDLNIDPRNFFLTFLSEGEKSKAFQKQSIGRVETLLKLSI
jgi:hypothetical protein